MKNQISSSSIVHVRTKRMPQDCWYWTFVLDNDKTNYLGAIRNTDFRLHPFGAFAFYFFIRFHLHKEAWPGLHKLKDWDRIRLLPGEASERDRPLNYTTHNSWIHKGFKQIGLINSKTT